MKSIVEIGITVNSLITNLDLLIAIIDFDGRITDANERWLATMTPKHSQLDVAETIQHWLTGEAQRAFDQALEQVREGQSVRGLRLVAHNTEQQPLLLKTSLWLHHVADNTPQIVACFQDVTLEEDGRRDLETLFGLSMDLMGIADFEGKFVRLNPAWEKLLGYTLAELEGRQFIDFVHPDDVARTQTEAVNAVRGESESGFTNRYRHRDGSYRWLSWHSMSYEQWQRTYFVARDVTIQKDADDRLRQATKELQDILDNSGTVISMKAADGSYLLVNREFAQRFGRKRQQVGNLVGLTDYDIFPSTLADTLRANDVAVLEANSAMQFEETLPGDDGLHTYLATKFVLRDADDNPYGVCTISTDITYRKLTEMQLKLRNQAIENSPSCISIADAGLHDMPLIYINPAFEQTTGYSPLEVIGRNCRFLQREDRDQPAIDEIRTAIANKEAVTVVLRNYRKSGELFYNELSLAPIHDVDGQLTHYVGISSDVTKRVETEAKIQEQNAALVDANYHLAMARKQSERAAQQIQKQNDALLQANRDLATARKQAEDATRLKSQFLATMSHELRTPLNAIIGYTEIQLAGMAGELEEEQRDYQNRVLANADHLLALINDVLDIAKIEAGRMELVNKSFDLRQWMDEIVAQMSVLADDKGLAFEAEVDQRMPKWIVSDPARIRQIAINLLSNAIKFTEEGYVRLQVRKHGPDAWKLIVADSGVGIPPHMQETIFEEFRQVDSSSLRKTGGTGLGLAIVRHFALMMGGNVRVKSDLSQGSIFTVILPLVDGSDSASK